VSDYEDALRLKTIADPFRRYQIATRRIDKFIEEDRYFYHSVIAEQSGRTIRVGGKEMVMLGSYSYLGLLNHPRLVEAACRATAQFGTGAHGVRVLAGTTELHRELEAKLASFMAAEDALVFSSGFITNVATIGALVRAGDVIIGDEWNHASIVDGCTFSRAELLTFKHNDMDSLEACLGKAGSRHA
jgi:7-keto-8-aminopelargonate synthetase-like enzyme